LMRGCVAWLMANGVFMNVILPASRPFP
jgi:hypothetical protein